MRLQETRSLIRKGLSAALALGAGLAMTGMALAAGEGYPRPGQLNMQDAASPIAHEMHAFHDLLLWIIIPISIFVLILLIVVAVKFNEKANPTPSKTTHHTGLEVAWTVAPVMILVIIAIPSFRLLTHQLQTPKADMTLKVTGQVWQWQYEYPKETQADTTRGFKFVSYMKDDKELKAGDIRMLSVDNEAVVPVNKVVRLDVTSDDVIHSFVLPAFGVRIDAVPGRLNQSWFKAEREGIYYGQCSKLCGKNHAYMPIAIRVVSEDAYAKWLGEAKKKFTSVPSSVTFADATAATRQ